MDYFTELRADLGKYYAHDPEERDYILAYLPEQPADVSEAVWLRGIVRDLLQLATERGDLLRVAVQSNKRLRDQLHK